MIFYISDTHFGHENIIHFTNRPYSDGEKMNSDMIRRWNEKVKNTDTVYVLGDMFFRCDYAEEILSQLKGKKHLIVGNHDGSWMTEFDATPYFKSINNMITVSAGNVGVSLCHYPLVTWPHMKKTYMIHGHLHDETNFDFWPILRNNERILNAGVDINGFEPVTLEELIENNRKFKESR